MLLWLFGPQFVAGYHLMLILAVGLLARAALGPVERLLSMLGEQRICATIYAIAFVLNIVLCVVLIPRIGIEGAAISTTDGADRRIHPAVHRHPAPARLPRLHLRPREAGLSAISLSTMHAPLSTAYRAEWRGLADLAPLADEIRALAARAVEPNVFYEPAFMLAAAPVFGAGAGAMLVRSATGRLTGLFPARIERPQGGLVPMLSAGRIRLRRSACRWSTATKPKP